MIELWKDIVGDEGLYQVSDQGRIKSLSKVKIMRNPYRKFMTREIILRNGMDTKGYNQVVLHKNGKQHTVKVHRLVAVHFIPNHEDLPEVNHIGKNENGEITKLDNRAVSLEWATSRENVTFWNASQKKKSSQYTGVSKIKKNGKWGSSIWNNGKLNYLGEFLTEEDASLA